MLSRNTEPVKKAKGNTDPATCCHSSILPRAATHQSRLSCPVHRAPKQDKEPTLAHLSPCASIPSTRENISVSVKRSLVPTLRGEGGRE